MFIKAYLSPKGSIGIDHKTIKNERYSANPTPANKSLDLGLIAVPGTKIKIMEAQVAREIYRRFLQESGYKPENADADELLRMAYAHHDEGDSMGWLNREDCERFIEWTKNETGDNTLRLPTENEWLQAKNTLGTKMRSWGWERLADRQGWIQLSREYSFPFRGGDFPSMRDKSYKLRLVSDANK